MKLTIISHTEHFRQADGQIVGLASTVMEINRLLDVFENITHVAMLHNGKPPLNILPYSSKKIRFVAIPAVGGQTFLDKMKILNKSLKTLSIIKAELDKSHYFQFRAPTGIGVFVVPYLVFFYKGKGWFKYAGNWSAKGSPLAYKFQRYLLAYQKRLVTINGQWDNLPKHCLTFENPCLTQVEVSNGQIIRNKKKIDVNNIHICFVGRLEDAKGLSILIKGINELSEVEKSRLKMVHIVGDGHLKNYYVQQAQKTNVNFKFYGVLSRSKVHDIYKVSHAILLPSASEGFPKVIAEAMNYGCVPIVSNISGISQYIVHNESGYLMNAITLHEIVKCLRHFLSLEPSEFYDFVLKNSNNVNRFTYSYYNKHITDKILIARH